MDGLASLISFEGRTSRRYFWLRQLIVLLWWIGFFILFSVIFRDAPTEPELAEKDTSNLILVFFLVGVLGSTLLNLSAVVRRYHDRGKSGLWFFICFIPLIGPIWQLVELGFLPGQRGDNEYGPGRDGGDAFSRAYSEATSQHEGARDHPRENAARKAPPWAKGAETPAQTSAAQARMPRGQFGVKGL